MAFDPKYNPYFRFNRKIPYTTTIPLVNGVLTVISDGDPIAKAGSIMTLMMEFPKRFLTIIPNNITEQDLVLVSSYRGGTNTQPKEQL